MLGLVDFRGVGGLSPLLFRVSGEDTFSSCTEEFSSSLRKDFSGFMVVEYKIYFCWEWV